MWYSSHSYFMRGTIVLKKKVLASLKDIPFATFGSMPLGNLLSHLESVFPNLQKSVLVPFCMLATSEKLPCL